MLFLITYFLMNHHDEKNIYLTLKPKDLQFPNLNKLFDFNVSLPQINEILF
jgi:hypothetical protein